MNPNQTITFTAKRWSVVAYRSQTTCRVWRVKHLKEEPMHWGPYKRKRYAKKIATGLRKGRVKTLENDGSITDHGPSFVRVQVIENED
jgi:hypothetical protein